MRALRCRLAVSFGFLILLAGSLPVAGWANGLPLRMSDFTAPEGQQPTGWKPWAARDEIAPRCYVDSIRFRSSPNALAVSGASNVAAYGGWTYDIQSVEAGKHYRFTAYYQTAGVPHESHQVVARIDWLDGTGRRTGQPDYAYKMEREGQWKRLSLQAPAPQGATRAKLELFLGWAPQGTVWWDDVTFEEVPAPPSRVVRIGSVSLRPRDTGGKQGSLEAFCRALDQVALGKPDIVCLGEGITVVGNREKYVAVAEPVPGPVTDRLGEKARQHRMYIVAGVYERDGPAVYNTAVLIDRQGKVAGKYRKVYLPREEIEGGLTPGLSFPVFDTDFGRVGMMICWDVQYVDPARALAAQGAEIILLPIWGGDYTLMKARAIENHVFLVSAGYDAQTAIINPMGEVLHATKESGVFKTVPVDLNHRFVEEWLGDMRGRFHKETRWDVSVAGVEP
ncbi:MAG: carbon-nitrogen hydrolase family protein [Acidobacteriota bacterium]